MVFLEVVRLQVVGFWESVDGGDGIIETVKASGS